MGSPECQVGRALYNEDEVQVTLTHDFEIGQFEASQAEWTHLGLPNPSGVTDAGTGDCLAPDCPVGGITWFDALEYANRFSAARGLPACYRLEGCTGALGQNLKCTGAKQTTDSIYECSGYRLPTEAEWEYAVRAGSRDAFYGGPMLPQPDPSKCLEQPNLESSAWYCRNSGGKTHPRGQRVPNAWGLHDTLGNAFEWVSDEYSGLGYGTGPLVDPGAVLGTKSERVRRGGVVIGWGPLCTVSKRLSNKWDSGGPAHGFRLARTLGR